MKGKGRGKALANCYKLPTPVVLLLCVACLLIGFYGSTAFVSQDSSVQDQIPGVRGRKSLEVIQEENADLTDHGESGDDYISHTPFQAFNVLRYERGQKYNSHYDYFNPAEYGPQKSQRMASFLLYLSDVEEGGETMFPFEGHQNMNINYDYKKCIGLKVKPRQGDALLFYSMFPNGTFDRTSLHGSCPVIKGEKWVATKWIRDQDKW